MSCSSDREGSLWSKRCVRAGGRWQKSARVQGGTGSRMRGKGKGAKARARGWARCEEPCWLL